MKAIQKSLAIAVLGVSLGTLATTARAAPYASNVAVSGTTVNFILNEGGSTLTYSINGGPAQVLDGTTKGAKSFSLSSPTDTFSITASKTDTVGYQIINGSIAAAANGLSQPSNTSGMRLVSDDTNVLGRFNSPRGVAVNNSPNTANFGTAYISNTAAGTVAAGTGTGGSVANAPARTTTGKGIYALRADESDAFGYGNAGQNPGSLFDATSASSPFRLSIGTDGNVYASDFSDAKGNVYRLNSNLTSNTALLVGIGGPSTVPNTQNHGSTTAAVPLITANGLTLYTLDEDMTMAQTGGTTADKNNLLRYDIGTSSLPYGGAPVRINQNAVLLSAATSDLDLGADGKFYLAQNRSGGLEPGIVVLNPDGSTAFSSLTASRTLLNNPTAADIFRNVLAMDVSDDQKFLAVLLNNSDVAVVPLVNGIPDIANRVVVDTGIDINSGRDIAFDAAGNIHYVSSGQGIYRVLSPGGIQSSTLSFDGTNYSFISVVPEPTSIALLGMAGAMLRRRRA